MSKLHDLSTSSLRHPRGTFLIALALVCVWALLIPRFSRASAAGNVNIQEIPGANRASDEIATARDVDNNQWAVWKDTPTGWYYQIWYSTRRGTNPWTNAQVLETSQDNSYKPTITITPNDVKFVAWEEYTATHRIAYVQFTSTPGEPIFLPGDGRADYEPVVASSADGTRHMVFSRAGTIYHAQTTDGLDWTFDAVSNPSANFFFPAVAIDDSTHLISVAYWSASNNAIYFAQRDEAGGLWKNQMVLGTGKDVAMTARSGQVAVSWTEGTYHQPAVRILQNGIWSEIQHPSPYSGGFRSHIVLDSAGNPHMIWMQDIDDANYDIFASDFMQGQWTTPQDLNPSPGLDKGNDLVIDSNDVLHAVFLEFSIHKTAFSADWRSTESVPLPLPTGLPKVPAPTATPALNISRDNLPN